MKVSFTILLILCCLQSTFAQAPDSLLHLQRLSVRFDAARSVAADPSGRLYIADAARHVVHVLDADGQSLYVLGGPGTSEGEFDSPSGVDPTNGLVIVVADAGNNRLQRFTGTYQLIDSIPLYAGGAETVGATAPSGALAGWDSGVHRSPGVPTAVSVSSSNEIFAIDGDRGFIAKWSASRSLVGFIGAGDGSSRLLDPVDLEVVGDQVFVADLKGERVLMFDLFGGYVTSIGGGHLTDLSGLGSFGDRVLVLHGGRLSVYDRGGTLLRSLILAERDRPVDVAATAKWIYVLFGEELARFPASRLEMTSSR